MINFRVVAIILTLVLTLIGGMIMANAQDKPPLLDISSSQTPPILRIAPQPVPPAQSMPVSSRIPQEIVKNAPLAVITAQKAKKYLTPGKVWSVVGPRGEVEIKAAIIYDGIAVAVLHFNSSDGMLLPLGIHPVEIGVSSTSY